MGGLSWGGGGGGVVDVKSWSKMLFLGTFWKITTYWSPLVERVRSSFAEKRNVESGTSTREDRSKTAQKPLKSCLKNRSKITARNERFLSGFLSKIWAVWAVFPKKNRPNRPNRSNRSNLAGKPLKPLKSWAVFERDLDPGKNTEKFVSQLP